MDLNFIKKTKYVNITTGWTWKHWDIDYLCPKISWTLVKVTYLGQMHANELETQLYP